MRCRCEKNLLKFKKLLLIGVTVFLTFHSAAATTCKVKSPKTVYIDQDGDGYKSGHFRFLQLCPNQEPPAPYRLYVEGAVKGDDCDDSPRRWKNPKGGSEVFIKRSYSAIDKDGDGYFVKSFGSYCGGRVPLARYQDINWLTNNVKPDCDDSEPSKTSKGGKRRHRLISYNAKAVAGKYVKVLPAKTYCGGDVEDVNFAYLNWNQKNLNLTVPLPGSNNPNTNPNSGTTGNGTNNNPSSPSTPNSNSGNLDTSCVVDGRYGPSNNCHDHANKFCAKVGGAQQCRAVECQGDVVNDLANHTINIYLKDAAQNLWCVVEPQSGKEKCFTNHVCSVDDVETCKGSSAETAIEDMCQGQYNSDECSILSDGEKALTSNNLVDACSSLGERQACLACCESRVDYIQDLWLGAWKGTEKPQCAPNGSYKGDVRDINNRCIENCASLRADDSTSSTDDSTSSTDDSN